MAKDHHDDDDESHFELSDFFFRRWELKLTPGDLKDIVDIVKTYLKAKGKWH